MMVFLALASYLLWPSTWPEGVGELGYAKNAFGVEIFRSLYVMLDSRLRSFFSMAFCRHRARNSHSAQCRFRMRSGGESLDSNEAILPVTFRTSLVRAEVFTFNVAWSSP